MIIDVDENITEIKWTVTNKVKEVTYGTGKTIHFDNNPMGRRIQKTVTPPTGFYTKTLYFLDAQGNPMSTYEIKENVVLEDYSLYLSERNIYGSSRIGLEKIDIILQDELYPTLPDIVHGYNAIGDKRYELSNHLGNVLEVITDRKLPEGEASYFMHCDGVNDYLTTSSFNAGLGSNVTLEAWVRTTASGANQVVASQYIAGGPNKGVNLFVMSDGKAAFLGRSGTATTISSGSGTTAVNDGAWHHLTGTCDGTVWRIYVDGVLENSYTASTAGSFSSLTTNFYVGKNAYAAYFNGDIKKVSYWNTTRTATDIAQVGNTIFTGSETGLVGYWPLADNTNPSDDVSSGNHNLSLYNGAAFNSQNVISYYLADVVQFSDYYPFGMQMPNRHDEEDDSYRYGFQNQEKDDEIKGEGNSVNYKYRMHDPRIGRFFAIDPLAGKYPHNSPYAFSENIVTNAIELEGLEHVDLNASYTGNDGKETTYKQEHNITKTAENGSYFTTGKNGEEFYAVPNHLYKGTDGKLGTENVEGSAQFSQDLSSIKVPERGIDYGNGNITMDILVFNAPGEINFIQVMTSDGKDAIDRVNERKKNAGVTVNSTSSVTFIDGGKFSPDGEIVEGKPYYYTYSQASQMTSSYADKGKPNVSLTIFNDNCTGCKVAPVTRVVTAVIVRNYAGGTADKVIGYIEWGFDVKNGSVTNVPLVPNVSQGSSSVINEALESEYPNY